MATQTGVRRDSLINSTTTSTISQENSVTLLRRADGQFYGLDPVYFNVGLYNPATRRWQSFPYSGPYIDNPGLTVLGNALVVNVGGVLYSRTF
ncbi:MAG: hypothetical protein H7330_00270 [Hymenobacteraceae bacterium]|nr:hypothetical protein [Hymenobacteraceae bacterium]